MHAIEMLTKQHRELERDFKAIFDASPAARRELFLRCADVLMSHVLVEENCFYPAVKGKRTEDILLESLEEHLGLKRFVADLVELPVADAQFEPKLKVLKEQAEHHHKEEEEKLFPKVKKLLSKDELDALGEEMGRTQAEFLRLHPSGLAEAQSKKAAALS